MATSILGGVLSLGPVRFYIRSIPGSGGTWIDLGGTDSTKLKMSVKKTDLMYSQYGDSPADAVQTGSTAIIEAGLAQNSLERMEATVQGFRLRRDSNGIITGWWFGSDLGTSDSSIWRALKLTRLVGGIESTAPFDAMHCWRAAPKNEIELTYDATTQRFQNCQFTLYLDETHVDDTNHPTFFGSANIAL